MKTFTKTIHPNITYDLEAIGPAEGLLFFDIETTGLSREKNFIYLIGCTYQNGDSFELKQWFAESKEAEKEILLHFLTFASRFSHLVHFNGDAFDLPFINARKEASGFDFPFPKAESFDLYKHLKGLKHMLALPDCRQKSLESALGVVREDRFSGGELISVYDAFRKKPEDELLTLLLLHNEEDVLHLPELTNLLVLEELKALTAVPEEFRLSKYHSYDSDEELTEGFLSFRLEGIALPCPLSITYENLFLRIQNGKGLLRLPVFEDTLLLFFEDYKNYYYLPAEDTAMHKSVAEFVDKSARKKATAKTCYQHHKGRYFTVPEKLETDVRLFYRSYKGKPAYALFNEALFSDRDFVSAFILALLRE